MISFNKLTTYKGESYACVVDETSLGYLHKEPDGFYYFFPNHIPGMMYPGYWLKELGFKLQDLNEAETQRQLMEVYGHSKFTD